MGSVTTPAHAAPTHHPATARRRRRRRLALGLLLAAALGVGAVAWKQREDRSSRVEALDTYAVRYELLRPTLTMHGELESTQNHEVVCRVQSRTRGRIASTTIRWVIEDGTRVRKGQVLAELDDTELHDELVTRKVFLDQAEAEAIQAEENYKIVAAQNAADIRSAEVVRALDALDLEKYVKGDYEQQRKDLLGRISLAESNLKQWHERANWSERMARMNFVSKGQMRSDQAFHGGARFALDKLREELRVLQEQGRKKAVADLQNKLAEASQEVSRLYKQARAREAQADFDRVSKQRIHQRRLARYKELKDQIEACTLRAPCDGLVVYSVSDQSRYGTPQWVIAQGEAVREGQVLMRIPELNNMQVIGYIHEALIARIHGDVWESLGLCDRLRAVQHAAPHPLARLVAARAFDELDDRLRDRDRALVREGEPAVIHLSAFPDQEFRGRVKSVANIASQLDYGSRDVRGFKTRVVFDQPVEGLRPGMNAEVSIQLEGDQEPVLTLPASALVRPPEGGKVCSCFVQTAAGGWEERTVVVGQLSGDKVEIVSGLREGDEVVLDPKSLLRERKGE